MSELLFSLMLWIGDNSQYDIFLKVPNISQVESTNICNQYLENGGHSCKSGEIIGFYNKSNTIYLPLQFNAITLNEQSQLLHELIHFVQWENMHTNEQYCLGMKEAEAYHLQNKWRAQHNLKPVSDPFTLLLLETSCEES